MCDCESVQVPPRPNPTKLQPEIHDDGVAQSVSERGSTDRINSDSPKRVLDINFAQDYVSGWSDADEDT